MPTEKPRITFVVSPDLLTHIQDFQYDNRIRNQTQALVHLIEKGLKKDADEKENSLALESTKEYKAMQETSKLLTQLFITAGYIETADDFTEKDLRFMRGVVDLIDTYFSKKD